MQCHHYSNNTTAFELTVPTCPDSSPSAWRDWWGEYWGPRHLHQCPTETTHHWTLTSLCETHNNNNKTAVNKVQNHDLSLGWNTPDSSNMTSCSHLSRVQLTSDLLTSHRYPVAKPTKRPSWSLTTMRSPLAGPLFTEPCCGATLLLWKRWRKTPSAWTVTGPLSCSLPTQLPFFSLQAQVRVYRAI